MYPSLALFAFLLFHSMSPALGADTGHGQENSLPAQKADAGTERYIKGVRSFMRQGQIDLAISSANTVLARPGLSDNARYTLLLLLAEAREKLASLRHFSDIRAATLAYRNLHREFPGRFGEEKLQWKLAWLNWNSRDYDRADMAAQAILKGRSHGPEVKKAALLHARNLIRKRKFAPARSILLTYFGLNPDVSAREEAQGLAWLAVIDAAEHQNAMAYRAMQKAYDSHPEAVEESPVVYATYIRLLAARVDKDTLLHHISRFVKRHIAAPEASGIRLMQADILAARGHVEQAITIYGILADRHGEGAVGVKARMRGLMLGLRGTKNRDRIQHALSALGAIAAKYQLTDIEAEARLHQARLTQRLDGHDTTYVRRTLAYYALAASSENPRLSGPALKEGRQVLLRQLRVLLDNGRFLKAVAMWARFSTLRRPPPAQLSFAIARAYLRLMDFAHAEAMLHELRRKAGDSLWGQRITLELARLWMERGDRDAVTKVMRWLAGHEDTIYRQDFLLIAAMTQIAQHQPSLARQLLADVAPGELTVELRAFYWQARARMNEALGRWREAATAWRQLAVREKGEGKWPYTRIRAKALIKAGDYAEAERALLEIPESRRDDAWRLAMGVCALHTGRPRQAESMLSPVAAGNDDQGHALRARFLLAIKHSDAFVMTRP